MGESSGKTVRNLSDAPSVEQDQCQLVSLHLRLRLGLQYQPSGRPFLKKKIRCEIVFGSESQLEILARPLAHTLGWGTEFVNVSSIFQTRPATPLSQKVVWEGGQDGDTNIESALRFVVAGVGSGEDGFADFDH